MHGHLGFLFFKKKPCSPKRYEANRYSIQPIVTSRVIYSENERYPPPTRTLQISPFLVPTSTPTIGSLNSAQLTNAPYPSQSPQAPHFAQPSYFQRHVQPMYMHNTFHANSNTTNNSVLATDTPPSYNASHVFKGPELNVQRGDPELPTYNEALT